MRLATSCLFHPLAILAIPLVLTAGCKRETSEPPPDPSVNMVEALGNLELGPDALPKPDACLDPDDCTEQGMTAVLSGDVSGIDMLAYACVKNRAEACRFLSFALRGEGVFDDPVGAHAAAERGCKLGEGDACLDLGLDESMGIGGATQDFAAAHEHFKFACEEGAAMGCRYVAALYVEGKLGSPDPASALLWSTCLREGRSRVVFQLRRVDRRRCGRGGRSRRRVDVYDSRV